MAISPGAQTSYQTTLDRGVEGMAMAVRQSRPLTLPSLAEATRLTVTAGSDTDDLVVTIVDDETGQSYSFTATGNATEATLLANTLAAFAESDQLPMLFDLAGQVSTNILLDFTAKHANRSYTITATGGTNAGTPPAAAKTTTAGGSGVPFGRFVAFGDEYGEFDALDSGSAVGDIAGVLFRTDGNHFRSTDSDGPSVSDLASRGRTYSIMEEGRVLLQAEGTMTKGAGLHVRIANGVIGRARATSDSSNTVDASALATALEGAADGELFWAKISMGAQ